MNRFSKIIAFLQSLAGFLSADVKAELELLVAFDQNEGKIIIVRNLKKLRAHATSVLAFANTVETDKFFVAGENGITKIWMSDEFGNRIKKFLPKSLQSSDTAFDSFDLTENMFDSQIMHELGNSPLPKMSELVCSVAGMVAKQPNGEEGHLLANGYANLFYGSSDEDGRFLVLCVHRYDGLWVWHCNEFDERGKWSAGRRVFSLATVEFQTLVA